MTYAQICDSIINSLQDNAEELGVDVDSIREGKLGAILPPPFIDAYILPSGTFQADNSGVPFSHSVSVEIFVGVPSLEGLSETLRAGMLIVGKLLSVLEQSTDAVFDESGGISVESITSDSTVLRVGFRVSYDPYIEIP